MVLILEHMSESLGELAKAPIAGRPFPQCLSSVGLGKQHICNSFLGGVNANCSQDTVLRSTAPQSTGSQVKANLPCRERRQWMYAFLVVTTWVWEFNTDIWYVQTTDATKHPTTHRIAPQQRTMGPKMSTVQRWKILLQSKIEIYSKHKDLNPLCWWKVFSEFQKSDTFKIKHAKNCFSSNTDNSNFTHPWQNKVLNIN